MICAKIIIFISAILQSSAYALPPTLSHFNKWHCIEFISNIDKSKPYSYNIGDLPLVSWFNDKEAYSTINICSHMGSKLDEGKITSSGCLICPYHGLAHSKNSTFGRTMVFQDKLWWSYDPGTKYPPSIPFYNSKDFVTSYIKADVDANIADCVYNSMDLNHAAYVHNNAFGFGSSKAPTDVKIINYAAGDKLGLSFNYKSNTPLQHLKRNLQRSKNFNMYHYPYTTWSRVSLPNNQHLFVNINMLPLSKNKTRWLITLKHNYWKSSMLHKLMEVAGQCILKQDQDQLQNQANDNALKQLIIHSAKMKNEEHYALIQSMLKNYKYPSLTDVIKLYTYHLSKCQKV